MLMLRERFQMVLILNDKIGNIVSLLGISPANQDKTKQTNKKCSMLQQQQQPGSLVTD